MGIKETPKAARAYLIYEQMGPKRSLAKLADQLIEQGRQNDGKTTAKKTLVRHLEEWSTKYHWQERVAAYDTLQHEQVRIQEEEAKAQDRERKLRREKRREILRERMEDENVTKMHDIKIAAMEVLLRKVKQDEKGVFGINAVLKTALDEIRLSLGAPTTIAEQHISGNVESINFAAAQADYAQYEKDHPLGNLNTIG